MLFMDPKKRWVLVAIVFVLALGIIPLYLSSPTTRFSTDGNLGTKDIAVNFQPRGR